MPLTNTTLYPNLVYVGKNAPYTYPDRNNMAVAVVDPNTGLVIVPFKIDASPLSKPMQFFISASHWLDAVDGPMQEHIERLADRACEILAMPGFPS